ncbi:MAG: hypothetical protein ACJ8CR_36435 [Roseiflexaceae bacterium]
MRAKTKYWSDDRRPTTDDRRPTTDDRRPTTDACGLWSVVGYCKPSSAVL